MRIKKETADSLYATIYDHCVDEIQEVSSGDCVDILTEIISEDYENWSDEKCQKTARQFYDENYDCAYTEALESFEPSAQDEAMADIQRETLAMLAARGF
jgi:hypothetical protein